MIMRHKITKEKLLIAPKGIEIPLPKSFKALASDF